MAPTPAPPVGAHTSAHSLPITAHSVSTSAHTVAVELLGSPEAAQQSPLPLVLRDRLSLSHGSAWALPPPVAAVHLAHVPAACGATVAALPCPALVSLGLSIPVQAPAFPRDSAPPGDVPGIPQCTEEAQWPFLPAWPVTLSYQASQGGHLRSPRALSRTYCLARLASLQADVAPELSLSHSAAPKSFIFLTTRKFKVKLST